MTISLRTRFLVLPCLVCWIFTSAVALRATPGKVAVAETPAPRAIAVPAGPGNPTPPMGTQTISGKCADLALAWQGSWQGETGQRFDYLPARTAPILATLRDAAPNLALLSCGNMLGPALLSHRDGGAQVVAAMNALGFAAMAPGPHDFCGGLDNLMARAHEARFPFVCTNLVWPAASSTTAALASYTVLNSDSARILVLGAIGPEVIADWPGWNASIKVVDPVTALRAAYDQAIAAGSVDYVVVLGTLRFHEAMAALKKLPWVDLVITNQVGPEEVLDDVSLEYRLRDGRRICWSFHPGDELGHARLARTQTGLTGTVDAVRVPREGRVGAAMRERLVGAEAEVAAAEGVTIATFTTAELTSPGVALLDALRVEMNAEVAMIHAGALNLARPGQNLTNLDIHRFFAFPDRTALIEVDGATLERLFARRDEAMINAQGLLFAGIRSERGRVIVNGRVLDRKDTYRLATVEFLAQGGLHLLPASRAAVTTRRFTDTVRDYFTKYDAAGRHAQVRRLEAKTIRHDRSTLGASFNKFAFGGSAKQYQYSDPAAVYTGSDIPGLVGIPKRTTSFSFTHETRLDRPGHDLLLRLRADYFEFNKLRMNDTAAGMLRYEGKSLTARGMQPFAQLDLVGTVRDPSVSGKDRPLFGKGAIGGYWRPHGDLKILAGLGRLLRHSTAGRPQNSGVNLGWEYAHPFSPKIDLSSRLDYFASFDSDRIRMFDLTLQLQFKITRHLATLIRESDFGWRDATIGQSATRRDWFFGLTFETATRQF